MYNLFTIQHFPRGFVPCNKKKVINEQYKVCKRLCLTLRTMSEIKYQKGKVLVCYQYTIQCFLRKSESQLTNLCFLCFKTEIFVSQAATHYVAEEDFEHLIFLPPPSSAGIKCMHHHAWKTLRTNNKDLFVRFHTTSQFRKHSIYQP